MHVGDAQMLILTLDNLSDADANVTLKLNVPYGRCRGASDRQR